MFIFLQLILFSLSEFNCPGDGTCSNQGICDDSSGICKCDSGFEGQSCQGKMIKKNMFVLLEIWYFSRDTYNLDRKKCHKYQCSWYLGSTCSSFSMFYNWSFKTFYVFTCWTASGAKKTLDTERTLLTGQTVWKMLCILDKSCPGSGSPCNGNGQCDFLTGTCICNTGSIGTDCSGQCNLFWKNNLSFHTS